MNATLSAARICFGNTLAAAGATTASGDLLPPVLILILCVIAGIATVFLLPGRREGSIRKIGGAVLIAAGLILAALLTRLAAARNEHQHIYFWVFASIALVSATRVVTHPRPVYSALYFVLTVFASAGLFVLLAADFMAAALVLIYAGAILITYVFVIMLAAQATTTGTSAAAHMTEYDAVSREPLIASCVGFALMGILLFVIFDLGGNLVGPRDRTGHVAGGAIQLDPAEREVAESSGATQRLGVYLFKSQVVNLELAGLILTVSMVGAILIARRRVFITAPHGGPETVIATMTPINDDPHSIPVYGTRNPRQKEYPET